MNDDLAKRLNAALPAPPYTPDTEPISVWVDKPLILKQPLDLDVRLCHLRHAIQALDLDRALELVFDLEGETHAINRAAEPNLNPHHDAETR